MIINAFLIILSIVLSGAILVLEDRRYRLAVLAVIELIGFILIVQIWPIALALVKLISGWMGIALLSFAFIPSDIKKESNEPIPSKIFRLMLGVFGWIIVLTSIQGLNEWLPISYTNLFIGLIFFIIGMISLSLGLKTFDIILSLLVFLQGFDIIYSSLEGSALVTAMFAVIIISICLTGSFLEGGIKLWSSD